MIFSRGGPAAGLVLVLIVGLIPAAAGCAPGNLRLGVADHPSRDLLRREVLAFARRDGLYLSRGDGSGERKILPVDRLEEASAVFLPRLSPDGGRLAFLSLADLDVRDSSGKDFALNILGLDDGEISSWTRVRLGAIVPPRGDGRHAATMAAAIGWSATADRLALALNRPDGRAPLIVLFDAVGDPTSMIDVSQEPPIRLESLSWEPHGRWLLLGMAGDGVDGERSVAARLFLPDGGPPDAARLEVIGPAQYPVLSPDGRFIAAVDGGWDMVLLDEKGTPHRRFERPAGRAINRPFWSPGGRFLYYHSLASTGPLGLIEISMIRCLDTRSGKVWDLVRLG